MNNWPCCWKGSAHYVDPAFPRPVKIGRVTRFRESDAQTFIATTAEARR